MLVRLYVRSVVMGMGDQMVMNPLAPTLRTRIHH